MQHLMRVAGGGCLSLINHFADWCEGEESCITGNWDMSHKLQYVYRDGDGYGD